MTDLTETDFARFRLRKIWYDIVKEQGINHVFFDCVYLARSVKRSLVVLNGR